MQERPKYDEKLELILRTAAAVFAEKGYHQASIRDISRAAGVSLSGLYYYVDSKEELLYLIQERAFGTILEKLDGLLEGVADPLRRLRILIESHLRFFVANMEEMKVLSHEGRTLTGEYRRRVNEQKQRYADRATQILEALRPEDGTIDVRVATYSLFGMMNWIYNWYHPERDVPVAELAEDMSRIFLRGYLSSAASPDAAEEAAPGDSRPSIWQR